MVKNHLIMLTTLYICCGLSVTRHVEEIIIYGTFKRAREFGATFFQMKELSI